MKMARLSVALFLVCALAGTAFAQPRGDRGGRGQGGGFGMMMGDGSPMQRLTDTIKKLDLTSDQKDKLEALKKEYEPKFKAIREKREKILTDDQKKAVADAMKAAREATGDDRRAAYGKVRDAMKLTDDQKKDMEAVMKEGRDLFEEVRPKVMDVLTDTQKEDLKKLMPQRGARGDRGRAAHRPRACPDRARGAHPIRE